MKIKSAKFVKGVVGPDKILENIIPQIAFIGRSNVGKSSVINAFSGKEGLAKTSAYPGRTQELNVFLFNDAFYLVDLPGYGFAKASKKDREWIFKLINWYLFNSRYEQKKIVLIIDANVGLTQDDREILQALASRKKNVFLVANKIDKIKKADYKKQWEKIAAAAAGYKVIPFSAKNKIGLKELAEEILK